MHKLVLLLLVLIRNTKAECDDGCKKNLHILYEDIKCKPIYEQPTDCCALKYDCSHLENVPEGKCLYQKELYGLYERIPNELTRKDCMVLCHCSKASTFICGILECPEWMGYTPKFGCHFKYDQNKCCSVGQVCGKGNVKCEVDEKTYLEGQAFTPPGQCLTCVCQEGFRGEYVKPFCRKTTCSVEIRNSKKIQEYCAPVYENEFTCCPYEWICENNVTTIVEGPESRRKPDATCKFGKTTLNIGDNFAKDGAKCECKLPPFVTCLKA